VVEPVSLTVGAIVAALVVKAAEKGGEQLAEGAGSVLGRVVGWLRARFSKSGDEEGSAALAGVEEVPDSPSRAGALAKALDSRAAADPEFKAELEKLIEEAKGAGVEVKSISQSAIGDQNAQVADVQGSTVTVSYGTPPPPAATGR
jgi:hypothetical protein